MKKFMVALLAVLMLSSAAWAASVEVDGSYYVRGRYFSNPGLDLEDDYDPFSNYDHELDLWSQINVSDTTFVRFRFEIADENWPGDGGGIASDDNLEVQRVWGGHTFTNGTKFEFGKMTGGTWATSFAEAGEARYRLKLTQPLPIGTLLAIIEKKAENGSSVEDSEKNDSDAYYVGLVTKAGNINVKPLVGYINDGSQDLTDDGYRNTFLFQLGLDGTFGIIGFESEFDYTNINYDDGADVSPGGEDSASLFGLYFDVYAQLDALKPGVFFAYGSVDDDAGLVFNFGDDFDGHGAEMIGNEFAFGGVDAIGGATYFGAYVNFAASDALSFFGQIGYAQGNSDHPTIEDDTALDISARGAYKITDAVTYTVGGGYASVDRDAGDDPDPGYKLYHKLAISF
ncbi:MAG: hypothetical protein QNJ22_13735 [Desulfosarcinaceae bacterium]|nr:hypothetical protein [Desulfosarcinaceae bacterium]